MNRSNARRLQKRIQTWLGSHRQVTKKRISGKRWVVSIVNVHSHGNHPSTVTLMTFANASQWHTWLLNNTWTGK